MTRILVTTHPFGEKENLPRQTLQNQGYEVRYNTIGRKYKKDELIKELKEFNPEIILAGTEKYDLETLSYCPSLQCISRVGIGVDGIDFEECARKGITVLNTPDAPSNAVAELTLGHMLNMLRKIPYMDQKIRQGIWERHIGKDLSESTVGIIGYGRIGKLVYKKLSGFTPKAIYVNDIDKNQLKELDDSQIASLETILRESDIITIHIPLDEKSKNLITKREFDYMKNEAALINTSRGGIIDEEDLVNWLMSNPLASAAVDTFLDEPYHGKLINLENCHLSPHAGSCTEKSRLDMELGAVLNATAFIEKMKNEK